MQDLREDSRREWLEVDDNVVSVHAMPGPGNCITVVSHDRTAELLPAVGSRAKPLYRDNRRETVSTVRQIARSIDRIATYDRVALGDWPPVAQRDLLAEDYDLTEAPIQGRRSNDRIQVLLGKLIHLDRRLSGVPMIAFHLPEKGVRRINRVDVVSHSSDEMQCRSSIIDRTEPRQLVILERTGSTGSLHCSPPPGRRCPGTACQCTVTRRTTSVLRAPPREGYGFHQKASRRIRW